MAESIAYFSLLFGCWAYALLRGGAPEKVGNSIMLVGSVLTVLAVSGPATRFASVEVGIFAVDAATLVAFLILALRAERIWPLWVTALQGIGTAGHALRLADPSLIRWGYAFALAFWSYPMLLLLVLGTWSHQRRLARFGVDRSWSSSSDRWDRRPPGGPTV
jgi:hypothetical protein